MTPSPGNPISASHYISAGHAIAGIQDALVRANQAGQIGDEVLQPMLLNHAVPLLMAFSKEAALVSAGGGEVSIALFGIDMSAWWCRQKCYLKYQAINAGITAVSSFGSIGCGLLVTIPIIGFLLTGLCQGGVTVAASVVRAKANTWYKDSLSHC